jgi:sterol desaturase/sphingolipid hydroxylase (fatty acid hydroxylase superfamily)
MEAIQQIADSVTAFILGHKLNFGLFTGLVVGELILLRMIKRAWWNSELAPNIISSIIGISIDILIGTSIVFVFLYIYEHYRLFTVPMSLLGIAYVFFVVEFVGFLQHWAYHKVGILWALHSVHHSGTEMNIAVATRSLWGLSLLLPMQMILVPLLGASLAHLGVFLVFRIIYAYTLHTDAIPRLGWLDGIINTPSNHRVHHGRQVKYLDRNYSNGILLFDRFFGTYQREEEVPDYGLVEQVGSRNPLVFQTAGLRDLFRKVAAAPNLRSKIGYLIMPPGWSHDGNHRTAEAMRAREREAGELAASPSQAVG